MQKIILFLFVMTSTFSVFAQDGTIRRYYDTGWQKVSKDAAYYNVECKLINGVYQCKYFYAQSGKTAGRSTFADSALTKGIGAEVEYYESGSVKDSVVFDGKGYPANRYSFRENGTMKKRVFENANTKTIRTEFFDEAGKLLAKNTLVQVPASFEGGVQGWVEYLQKKLKNDIPNKNKAPVGTYTVVVTFVIGESGKIEKVEALTDPGYGTKEEAIRVVSNSPKWMPATENGKPVIYRQKQSITFAVTEEEKKKKN